MFINATPVVRLVANNGKSVELGLHANLSLEETQAAAARIEAGEGPVQIGGSLWSAGRAYLDAIEELRNK